MLIPIAASLLLKPKQINMEICESLLIGLYRMKIITSLPYVVLFLFAITSVGCTLVRDISDNIAGTYLKGLERKRENEMSRVVNYSIDESFERTLNILLAMDAKIMKVESESYAILAVVSGGPMLEDSIDSTFEANTADVGIFFSAQEPQRTKISINCFSTSILEHAANEIFSKI